MAEPSFQPWTFFFLFETVSPCPAALLFLNHLIRKHYFLAISEAGSCRVKSGPQGLLPYAGLDSLFLTYKVSSCTNPNSCSWSSLLPTHHLLPVSPECLPLSASQGRGAQACATLASLCNAGSANPGPPTGQVTPLSVALHPQGPCLYISVFHMLFCCHQVRRGERKDASFPLQITPGTALHGSQGQIGREADQMKRCVGAAGSS